LRTGLGENATRETISRWSAGTLVAGMEISPVESLTGPAGRGTPTIADSPEIVVADPTGFFAVRLNRMRWLRSLDVKRYVRPFAPAIDAHPPPAVSQRSQR
jgi:hypothetical protein